MSSSVAEKINHQLHEEQTDYSPINPIRGVERALDLIEAQPAETESIQPDPSDLLNSDNTYGEIYADTPAKALLWEARKIPEALRKDSSARDAALLEMAEAYSYIDPSEAITLIDQIKDDRAKMEAWAKFGQVTGDDIAVDRARKIAGRRASRQMIVANYGHNKEDIAKALKLKPKLDKRQKDYALYDPRSMGLNAGRDQRRWAVNHSEDYMGRVINQSYTVHSSGGFPASKHHVRVAENFFSKLVNDYRDVKEASSVDTTLGHIGNPKSFLVRLEVPEFSGDHIDFVRNLGPLALMRAIKENALELYSKENESELQAV